MNGQNDQDDLRMKKEVSMEKQITHLQELIQQSKESFNSQIKLKHSDKQKEIQEQLKENSNTNHVVNLDLEKIQINP